MENKKGRPRQYDFQPDPSVPNREAAAYLAALDELMERVIDQAAHLPQAALDYAPPGTTLTIGWLLKHLAWADARMFGIALGKSVDEAVEKRLEGGSAAGLESEAVSHGDAESLIDLMKTVRSRFISPWCREIEDIHQPVKSPGPLATVEKTFMHMCYHWSYHSGHIGLLSLQAGYDYTWTFPS